MTNLWSCLETRFSRGPTKKQRTPAGFRRTGFINSGNVLLSRNLEMHYHWGCSVSLPCSEWERVGPLRYGHQKAGEAEASPRGENRSGERSLLNFTRNSDDKLYCRRWDAIARTGLVNPLICNKRLTERLSERTRCSLKSAYWETTLEESSKIDCIDAFDRVERSKSRNNQAERVISTTELNTSLCLYP